MNRRPALATIAVAARVALAPPSPFASASPTPETAVIRVMTLNICYGGDELDLQTGNFCRKSAGCPERMAKVEDVIARSGADIVGIEEGEHNAGVIAQALGWRASERTQVISRYPIADPPGAYGLYVWVEVLSGRFVAIGNVHLPSDPYGPYEIRDGATLDEVLDLETSVRLPAIQAELGALLRSPRAACACRLGELQGREALARLSASSHRRTASRRPAASRRRSGFHRDHRRMPARDPESACPCRSA